MFRTVVGTLQAVNGSSVPWETFTRSYVIDWDVRRFETWLCFKMSCTMHIPKLALHDNGYASADLAMLTQWYWDPCFGTRNYGVSADH
jgi:hypothetical protein